MNQLAGQTSPYLLQHADNPVDWYPWSDEALEQARERDLPLLVSIGYAACHWCHVMERESFTDPQIAEQMNSHFICIKVDREERPDIDSIYMDAAQAMTGSGGWPLTAFCTPEGEPFYVGTYFPSEPRWGVPSFRQILAGISDAWENKREELLAQGSRVVEHIGRVAAGSGGDMRLTEEVTLKAFSKLMGSLDPIWGGFGGAPKFPQPMILEFVLRCALREWDGATDAIKLTLDRMLAGGIHDQVGGGFARYSTDERWHVPHFEKMLYDNAQLAQLLLRTWLVTKQERYAAAARSTLDFLIGEMRHPEGGFYSSQDADSEGKEGTYYTWSWDEIVSTVGEDAARTLGAEPDGNWEGTNVLWLPDGVGSGDGMGAARAALRTARAARVKPDTDDKILCGWNALAIRAIAQAGRALGERSYVDAAVSCARFVLGSMRRNDGRLLRSWRDGVTGGPAFGDDHALLGLALLDLWETTFDLEWFLEARAVADQLVELFSDPAGGFFTTGSDQERLVLRPKELYDNAVACAGSAGAELLIRLSLLSGEADGEATASRAIGQIAPQMAAAPSGFGQWLCALDLYLGPSSEIAIVGDPEAPARDALVGELTRERYLPNVVVAVASPGDRRAREVVPLLRDRTMKGNEPTAYVCHRFECKLPVTEPADLAAQLSG